MKAYDIQNKMMNCIKATMYNKEIEYVFVFLVATATGSTAAYTYSKINLLYKHCWA